MEFIKILLTRKYFEDDIIYIKKKLFEALGNNFEIISPSSYTDEDICSKVSDVDALLGPYITKDLLIKGKKLRLIQVPWTGLDAFNFDMMKYTTATLCNSHSNSQIVAEFAIALLLDLIKKISYHDRQLRKGNWNRTNNSVSLGSRILRGSSVAILGYGSIGRKIGLILKQFDVIINSIATQRKQFDEVDLFFCSDEWEKAVMNSDIVVCALPLTEKTRNLINQNSIKSFKKGSFIVNVSRAEIFEEKILFNSLLQGHIGGFASDVWWKNPTRGQSVSFVSEYNKFENLENVVFSPHRAGFVDGCLPHLDDAIQNMISLAKKNPFHKCC
jgi:lactate dehydrogenase-like 2-hydroxyacid dehydrogenase